MKARGRDHGEGYGRLDRAGIVRCGGPCGRTMSIAHMPVKRRRSALRFHGWDYNRLKGWHCRCTHRESRKR